ncbi:MAG: lipid-A-disaccharide synthase N-terminal domain-containing protein [Verrucomicrobiota bacterium]
MLKRKRYRFLLALVIVVGIPSITWIVLARAGVLPQPGKTMFPDHFNLSDRLIEVPVVVGETGEVEVRFEASGEPVKAFTAEEFLLEVKERKNNNRGWSRLFSALDITGWASIAWVVFGFLAQGVFMGRLLVQWWASEKARTSVVPTAFWWLSLLGATMLIVYFTWRKDPVGILGQSTGWFIYIRNLWFIYGNKVSSDEEG